MIAAALDAPPVALAYVPAPPPPSTFVFLERLKTLCGRSFEGRVASSDAADESFRSQRLVMTVAECRPNEVRVPFAVGEDRSRTWVVTLDDRTYALRLKHDHRHADGTPDELTNYGGETATSARAERHEFPADAESKALFTRTGRAVSNANVWALELEPGRTFAYELRRPERFFRVEFDLNRPVEP